MPNQHSTVSVSWSWQDHPDKVEITCAVKDEGIGKLSLKPTFVHHYADFSFAFRHSCEIHE